MYNLLIFVVKLIIDYSRIIYKSDRLTRNNCENICYQVDRFVVETYTTICYKCYKKQNKNWNVRGVLQIFNLGKCTVSEKVIFQFLIQNNIIEKSENIVSVFFFLDSCG